MTFEEWWKENRGYLAGEGPFIAADGAWAAATQAERERCARIARDVTAFTEHFDIGNEIAESIRYAQVG